MRQRLGSSKTGWASTVWIDPGGTTGWAVMNVDPVDLVNPDAAIHKIIQHWQAGEIQGSEDEMASQCLELFDLWDDAAIGMEKFTVRKFLRHEAFLSPVRVTAKVKYGLWLAEKWSAIDEEREMRSPRHVFAQEPALAKSTLTDDRQREWGLWLPGKDHKRDALKHCYTFMQRARESPRMRFFAWPSLFKANGDPIKLLPPTSKRSRY